MSAISGWSVEQSYNLHLGGDFAPVRCCTAACAELEETVVDKHTVPPRQMHATARIVDDRAA